jgi:hypothetical protein
MIIALVSRTPTAGRARSRLIAAEYIDLLAYRRISSSREVELQLALSAFSGGGVGEYYKGCLILAAIAGTLIDLDKA